MENDICSSYFQLYCEIFIYMRPVKKDGPELQFYFTVFACVNKSKNVSTSNCQRQKQTAVSKTKDLNLRNGP